MIRLILLALLLGWSACNSTPTATDKTTAKEISTEARQKVDVSAKPQPTDTQKAFDPKDWTDLQARSSTLHADIRYATTNNFVKQVLYPCGRCYLRPAVAEALLRVHRQLQQQGKGLKVYDCYRPLAIQWKMWEIVPDPRYVSDPSKGSMHNRGAAVDLTIVDEQGHELDMGTDFDFFGKEAWPEYDQHPAEVIANRRLLRSLMEAEGFKGIRTEWWHFSYAGQSYPISEAVWPCQ